MNVNQVVTELKKLGHEQTVNTYRRHGAKGELLGVKVADLKKVIRKVKGDQDLAMELWDTNISDAMYMASLMADGAKMTQAQLNKWAKTAWWYMLSEYSVPFVAAEHPQAFKLANKWMTSKKESIASSGWSTYALALGLRDDSEIDLAEVRKHLKTVESQIAEASNRVRYTMNGFVIAAGTYVQPVLKNAKATAKKIGKVSVDVGDTSCKVPLATATLEKNETMGRIGKKRTTAKC